MQDAGRFELNCRTMSLHTSESSRKNGSAQTSRYHRVKCDYNKREAHGDFAFAKTNLLKIEVLEEVRMTCLN